MKWHIKIADQVHDVEIASRSSAWQSAVIDGKRINFRYDNVHGVVSVEANGLIRNLDVRSLSTRAHEQEMHLKFECWLGSNVQSLGGSAEIAAPGQEHRRSQVANLGEKIRAPMTGKLLQILVNIGDSVTAGQTLAIIEAMKMENRIQAQSSGVVDRLLVQTGQNVTVGTEMIRIKA
jgi:biotin carboxyl carrier protein